MIAGGVGVPNLEVARRGRLTQRLDLAECDLRERHRAFVFISGLGHRQPPNAGFLPKNLRAHGRMAAPRPFWGR